MKRCVIDARPGWEAEVKKFIPSPQYWNETAYYQFSQREIDALEAATAELHRMTLLAVDRAVNDEQVFARFQIPAMFTDMVKESWCRGDPSVYGRLDLCYDGVMPPKLIEYNGDSPALLIESGPTQWVWFEQRAGMLPSGADQWNMIHDNLAPAWEAIKKRLKPGEKVHFVSSSQSNTADEDWYTCEYHIEVAKSVGIPTHQLLIEQMEYRADADALLDDRNETVTKVFKLYPWNWFELDRDGKHLPALAKRSVGFLEPPWKMLVDHKGLLALLWEMFPEHPNLLPAYFEYRKRLGSDYVTKPFYGCEGENITIHRGGEVIAAEGTYGNNPVVYQEYCELSRFGDEQTLVGSWLIGGTPSGICLREESGDVTTSRSIVTPHVIL